MMVPNSSQLLYGIRLVFSAFPLAFARLRLTDLEIYESGCVKSWGCRRSWFVEEVPSPKAEPGQVVVSVKACGVNFPIP